MIIIYMDINCCCKLCHFLKGIVVNCAIFCMEMLNFEIDEHV